MAGPIRSTCRRAVQLAALVAVVAALRECAFWLNERRHPTPPRSS